MELNTSDEDYIKTHVMELERHSSDNITWHPAHIILGNMSSSHDSSFQLPLASRYIIGVAGAALLLIALIALLLGLVWCRKRRISNRRKHEHEAPEVKPEVCLASESILSVATESKVHTSSNDKGHKFTSGVSTEDESETGTNTWGPVDALYTGTREHWLMRDDDIAIEEHVTGNGAFGDVRRGVLLGATPVAVKSCHAGADLTMALSSLVNEMRLLRRVRHPNIVLFFGVCTHPQLGLVLEWVEGVNLKQFVFDAIFLYGSMGEAEIDSQTNGLHSSASPIARPPESIVHEPKLLLDVSFGMQFLHAQRPPIVHRDLKPANVLVETVATPPRAKITDFGLSLLLQGKDIRSDAGTKRYMAPEVKAGLPVSASADVFSFGCTACFALTGQQVNQRDVRQALQSAMTLAGALESTTKELVSCVQEEPTGRPMFTQVQSLLKEWNALREVRWDERANATERASKVLSHRPSASKPQLSL